ncbi:hypothetical protein TNCV_4280681 [Trichonephila clavipes]|nr:hypothetical protein TNCV_4280681 [Trichonephila clavipes]
MAQCGFQIMERSKRDRNNIKKTSYRAFNNHVKPGDSYLSLTARYNKGMTVITLANELFIASGISVSKYTAYRRFTENRLYMSRDQWSSSRFLQVTGYTV